MSDYTVTPNYLLKKPVVNSDIDLWGDHLNQNADTLDTVIKQQIDALAGIYLPLTGGTVSGALQIDAGLSVRDTVAIGGAATAPNINGVLFASGFATLQDCIDALPAQGGEIVLPANTLTVLNAAISITKPNVIIRGGGPSTILQRGPALNAVLVNAAGANCVISDLTIDGNGISNTANLFAELLLSGQFATGERLYIINSRARHVALAGAYSSLRRSRIIGLNDPAILSYGVWAINHQTVFIRDNVISNCGIDAIGFDGDNSQVTGNHTFNCQSRTDVGGGQIASYGGANQIIANNTVGAGVSAVSSGIEVNSPSCVISGNNVSLQKWNGLALDANAHNAHITGNTITNNNQSSNVTNGNAIVIAAGVSNFCIVGNNLCDTQATATQRYGVDIKVGAANNYIVTNNLISGNTAGQIADGGTGTSKLIGNNQGVGVPVQAYFSARPNIVPISNNWYGAGASPKSTGAPTAGRLYAIPVPAGAVVTGIAVNVTATTGGSVRLGVYDDAGGKPGARLYDSGIMAIAATGVQQPGTISAAPSTNWCWLAAVFGSTSTPTVTAFLTSAAGGLTQSIFGAASAANAFTPGYNNGYYAAGYSDATLATALPANFGTATPNAAMIPDIVARF